MAAKLSPLPPGLPQTAAAALRARLAQLQNELRAALADKRSRIQAIVAMCRSERAALREQLKDKRKQALDQVDHEIQAARAGAKLVRLSRLAEARKAADSDITAARAAIAIERRHTDELRRIAYDHRRRRADVNRQHAVTVQGATLHAAVLGHFAPLFARVGGKVKPVPGESRAEALLRYAQTHPEEAHAAAEPRAEQRIEQTRQEIAKTKVALRTAPKAPKNNRPPLPKAPPAQAIRAPSGTSATPATAKAAPRAPSPAASPLPRAAATPVAGSAGKLSLRRPGQLPRGGGGMLLADLLRERAELAKHKNKAGKASAPEATKAAAPPAITRPPKPPRAKRHPATKPAKKAVKAKVAGPSAPPAGSPQPVANVPPMPPANRTTPPRTELTVKAPEVRDTAQIAKLIRQDIQQALTAGALPKATYSVKTEKYSMGSSINVVASKLPFPVLNPQAFVLEGHWVRFDRDHFHSRLTPEAQSLQKKLEEIVGAYHWDRSDSQSDYYNERFHQDIRLDDRGEEDQIGKALRAQAETRPQPGETAAKASSAKPTAADKARAARAGAASAEAEPDATPPAAPAPSQPMAQVIALRGRRKAPSPQQALFPESK